MCEPRPGSRCRPGPQGLQAEPASRFLLRLQQSRTADFLLQRARRTAEEGWLTGGEETDSQLWLPSAKFRTCAMLLEPGLPAGAEEDAYDLMGLHHVVELFVDPLVLLLGGGSEQVGAIGLGALAPSVLLLV